MPVDTALALSLPWRSDSASAGQPGKIPIIEVAYKKDMWWSMPQELSQALYTKHLEGETGIGYTWDWGVGSPTAKRQRTGSWVPDGEETTINRYVIDFATMEQKNIDNGRLRSIRIAWVDHAAMEPKWTGQIPQ